MIDTVKFEIPTNAHLLETVKSLSVERSSIDHNQQRILFQNYSTALQLGSYNRDLVFFYRSSTDKLYLEFSLPKFHTGHNVYLMYPRDLSEALPEVYSCLSEYLSELPRLSTWKVKRLDVCYVWKLISQESASRVMHSLQACEYPRHKLHKYDTSLMTIGSSYSTKFYLKQPEYYKHDFTILKALDPDMAHRLFLISEGVLRFEVTMRSKCIEQNFGDLYATDLYELDYVSILNTYMKKILPNQDSAFTDKQTALERLQATYKKAKALRLFQFWSLYYMGDEYDRIIIKQMISRVMIYRNKSDLRKAGVGLPLADEIPTLSIPSRYSVN